MQATPAQIQDFQLDKMAKQLETMAPNLWELVVGLLGGWSHVQERKQAPAAQERPAGFWENPEDNEHWDGDDVLAAKEPVSSAPHAGKSKKENR